MGLQEVKRILRRLRCVLDGVDLVDLHAVALGLQDVGARVRPALDAGGNALSSTATGAP